MENGINAVLFTFKKMPGPMADIKTLMFLELYASLFFHQIIDTSLFPMTVFSACPTTELIIKSFLFSYCELLVRQGRLLFACLEK